MAPEPVIRYATREDVPEILAMIKELAEFEKSLHEVQATEESLLSTLSHASSPTDSPTSFSEGWAKTFLITIPASGATAEQVAGMALYCTNYSTWTSRPGIYLEDLYVRPAFRRLGYATLLLQKLAAETVKISEGIGRLEWSCLKWNQRALDFYASLGAVQKDEWVGLRVEGQSVRRLAGLE